MKKILTMLAIVFFASTTYADPPYWAEYGKTITPEATNLVNEIVFRTFEGFDSIDDLVGTWECEAIDTSADCASFPARYSLDSSGLYYSAPDIEIVFGSDGTYVSDFDICMCWGSNSNNWQSSQSASYAVKGNSIILGPNQAMSSSPKIIIEEITRVSDYEFEISMDGAWSKQERALRCEKQFIPPEPPTSLTVSNDGLTVTLGWTDNSAGPPSWKDETEFGIYRKDGVDLPYVKIDSVDPNVVEYFDTVPSTGGYWYKIKAENAYGDREGLPEYINVE